MGHGAVGDGQRGLITLDTSSALAGHVVGQVLSETVNVPAFSMPPPSEAVFPDTVLSVTVSVAVLSMPPPALALPSSIVSPEIKPRSTDRRPGEQP